MLKLPENAIAYKRTATFTKDSVPKGLLGRHNTKEGTWGSIVVATGSIRYSIFDICSTVVTVTPSTPGVIEPQTYHKVDLLSDDTTFYVEFYSILGNSTVEVPKFIRADQINSGNSSDAADECSVWYQRFDLSSVGKLGFVVVIGIVAFGLARRRYK